MCAVVTIYIDTIKSSVDKDCVMYSMEGIGEFVSEFGLEIFNDLNTFGKLIESLFSLLYENVYIFILLLLF